MNSWHPITKLTVVVGGLAIGFLVMTNQSQYQTSAVAALPQIKRGTVAEQVEALELSKLAVPIPEKTAITAMVTRPLFAATRRPIETLVETLPELDVEFVETIEPTPIPEPEMSFVGSLIRDDAVFALVTKGFYGSVETVEVGEEVDGWKVLEIGDRAISLGLDDRRLEYRIFDTE